MQPVPPPPTAASTSANRSSPAPDPAYRTWQILMGLGMAVCALGVLGGLGVIWQDAADTTDDWHGLGTILGAMLAGASAIAGIVLVALTQWARRAPVAVLISGLWPAASVFGWMHQGSAPVAAAVVAGAWSVLCVIAFARRREQDRAWAIRPNHREPTLGL